MLAGRSERLEGRKGVGAVGEALACSWLEAHGMQILERNWRGGHTEVDIIALDAAGLHFVEVKTRVAPVAADPEDNVRFGKQHTLVKAAQIYLHGKDPSRLRLRNCELFFDIVSVVLGGGRQEVEYFPAAWVPMYV